jgi:hypothetical protein
VSPPMMKDDNNLLLNYFSRVQSFRIFKRNMQFITARGQIKEFRPQVAFISWGHGRFPKFVRHKQLPRGFQFLSQIFFIAFGPGGVVIFPWSCVRNKKRAILRVFSKFHIGLTNNIMHHLRGNLKYWRGLTTVAYFWSKTR